MHFVTKCFPFHLKVYSFVGFSLQSTSFLSSSSSSSSSLSFLLFFECVFCKDSTEKANHAYSSNLLRMGWSCIVIGYNSMNKINHTLNPASSWMIFIIHIAKKIIRVKYLSGTSCRREREREHFYAQESN